MGLTVAPTTQRAKITPKNPYGVAPTQRWVRTDNRVWDRVFTVEAVYLNAGVAKVKTKLLGDESIVRLDRFSPKHHYRLLDEPEEDYSK